MIVGKTYDALKYIAQILLPALGTLYFALAQIWGLPSAPEVVGTITVVDTFLGVALQISSTNYNKSDAKYDGTVDIFLNADKSGHEARVGVDVAKLSQKDEVRLKVDRSNA